MAKKTINNGDAGSVARASINDNFTELYDDVGDLEDATANISAVDGVTYITIVGLEAGDNNSGIRVNAFGYQALKNNSADQVNGFGTFAAESNAGLQSNAFGYNALADNTGDYSNGFGHAAVKNNTGDRCNGFGFTALQNNSGAFCDGVGYNALALNKGNYSCGIGYAVMSYSQGNDCVGMGYFALRLNNADDCVGIGREALTNNDGAQNTAVGVEAFNSFTEDAGSAEAFANTDINVGTDVITIAGHGFGGAGTYINLKWTATTGTLPAGITLNQIDQFLVVDANNIELITDNMTDQGAGNHTLTPQVVITNSSALGYNAEPLASNQVRLGNGNTETVYSTGKLVITQFSGALTDGAPTEAEINAATSLTPATAGAGYQCTVKDTNGTGLLYKVESDGTDWFYLAMTKAL